MLFLELMATLGMDASKYNEGLDSAEGRASSAGGIIARGLGVATAAVGAAIGAAATGVATLTMSAVSAYGEYEQLVGGVNKIFEDSSDIVMQYASNAYETAGLSANEYMQTVTGFSASLMQGLEGDTEAAAEIANLAITDMADNANTYGTDMASIQNAYMGFAKDNFTMLDNLKLGYGGTREEMIRLINDSGILEEQIDSLDDVTFDQMILAIHEIQEQTNIAGTTANEAASTIQGSIAMTRSAWENLVIGLGDSEQDLEPLIDNFITSAQTMIQNIIPVAEQALGGIANLIEGLAPVISEELPGLIDQILPPILNAATQIVVALTNSLPSILSTLTGALPGVISQIIPVLLQIIPQLISLGAEICMALFDGIVDNIDLILDAAMDLVETLVTGISENADSLVDSAVELVIKLVEFLTDPDNLETIITGAVQIVLAISEAIITHAPELIGAVVVAISNIIVALAESLPLIADQVGNFVADLGEDLGNWLYDMFGDELVVLGDCFADTISEIGDFASDVFDGFVELGADIIEVIMDFMGGGGLAFNDGLDTIITSIGEWGADVIEDFFDIFEDAKETVSNAVDALLDLFDFDWSLPDIKLPHFSVTGGEAPWGFGGEGTLPTIGVEWYAKAVESPMLLDAATIFGASGGKLLGGGETDSEIIYGRDNLMSDIAEAVAGVMGNMPINVTVYIGNEPIEDIMVNTDQRYNLISGGRG